MCIHSPGNLGQTVNTLLLVGSRLQLQRVHHRRPRLDRTCQPQDTREISTPFPIPATKVLKALIHRHVQIHTNNPHNHVPDTSFLQPHVHPILAAVVLAPLLVVPASVLWSVLAATGKEIAAPALLLLAGSAFVEVARRRPRNVDTMPPQHRPFPSSYHGSQCLSSGDFAPSST